MNPEHILVVDDELQMLRVVSRVLSSSYRTATARTPQEALDLAQSFQPDLAILDIRMPEMDGFALLRRLREVRPDLDVIFMTGAVHELDSHIIRSIREKAFYYIQKPFDREVLLTLVARCVELRRLAADNRRHVMRLEEQLEQARRFQLGMLPRADTRIEGADIAARYLPCDDLGGDFYDFAAAGDGRITTLIADVCGHGVAAAMLTAVVKSAFHEAHVDDYEPLSVVQRVGSGIRSFSENQFVTLFCARFAVAQRTMEYVNAGHPPAFLWGARAGLRRIEPSGPLIAAALPEMRWEQGRIELGAGDRFLLYTDGVTEARGEEGLYGEERLTRQVEEAPGSGATLLDTIVANVSSFCGGRPRSDDWTLLTLDLPDAAQRP